MSEAKNPWTTTASKGIYENPWIAVTEHQVVHPNGAPGIYGTVHFKNRAVGVLPIDDRGHTFLVGQYRYPHKKFSWEIPEGGQGAGETPEAAALRELAEETGNTAGRLWPFLFLDLSNSVTDENAAVFFAWDLMPKNAQQDDSEELLLRSLPFGEAVAMAMRGDITDAISVAALSKAAWLQQNGQLPRAVARRLEHASRQEAHLSERVPGVQ